MKRRFFTYTKGKIIDLKKESNMKPATLILNGISKNFRQGNQTITVLNNIDISFMQGKTYAITGLSGSGKSTLMHIIAGIDTPSSGTVTFNATVINTLPAQKLSQHLNRSVGLVFQSPHLIKELSVLENVMLPGMIGNYDTKAVKNKAHTLLEQVSLANTINNAPRTLSGGQQQRVALARALINNPAFLIADEPTGNLDLATGKTIIELILTCQKEWGMGIIISSHDEYVTEHMNEIYELVDGRLKKI
jgi:ABC-type lipoprotein export system ATPase subunit